MYEPMDVVLFSQSIGSYYTRAEADSKITCLLIANKWPMSRI